MFTRSDVMIDCSKIKHIVHYMQMQRDGEVKYYNSATVNSLHLIWFGITRTVFTTICRCWLRIIFKSTERETRARPYANVWIVKNHLYIINNCHRRRCRNGCLRPSVRRALVVHTSLIINSSKLSTIRAWAIE